MATTLTTNDIQELCGLPLRGHRYEFEAGNKRADGKYPLYIKAIALVQNGNRSYWSRRAPKKVWRTFDSGSESVQAMREALYVLNNRNRKGN